MTRARRTVERPRLSDEELRKLEHIDQALRSGATLPPCGCWCACMEKASTSYAMCGACKAGIHKENRI